LTRSDGDAAIELERADAPTNAGATTTMVATNPGALKRRRLGTALGLVAIVGFVAVALATDGGDRGDDQVAPSSTAAIPSTTGASPTSSTAVLTPAPIDVATPAPLLGANSGLTLLVQLPSRPLVAVELDSGTVRSYLRPELQGNSLSRIRPVGNRLVWSENGRVYAAGPEDAAATELVDRDSGVYVSVAAARVWVRGTTTETGTVGLDVLDLSGVTLHSSRLPASVSVVAAIDTGLVVNGSGRFYLVSADGGITALGTGSVVAAAGARIVWRECDETLQCRYWSRSLDQDDALHLRALDALGTFLRVDSQVSPDGRFMVLSSGDEGAAYIADLSTGGLRRLSGQWNATYAWAPDGSWLFRTQPNGKLTAVSTRNLEERSVLSYPTTQGSPSLAVVVPRA
jgi:hypothetical protein